MCYSLTESSDSWQREWLLQIWFHLLKPVQALVWMANQKNIKVALSACDIDGCLAARGCLVIVGLATCNESWRLALLGSCQCGVGAASLDSACSNGIVGRLGLQRTVAGPLHFVELFRCSTSSEDGASDYPNFLLPAMAFMDIRGCATFPLC